MSRDHFQLITVAALPDYRLRLSYADGQEFEVDLGEWIATSPILHPLKDAALFAQAKAGFAGRSVEWIADELDLGADNLRNLAIEQAGGIGHERIWNWLHETGLTLEQASRAVACTESWRRFRGDAPCSVESGSQTVNSALMGEARRVVSL